VEQGPGGALLGGGVDPLIAVLAAGENWTHQLLMSSRREAAVGLCGPLHRRANGQALRQRQVLSHADLVAVAQDRRAGQGEEEAVGQLQPATISPQHRRQPAPYPTAVDPHLLPRRERVVYRSPL